MAMFYGIGKGFQSKLGFTNPVDAHSYVVSFIRPPFTVSGSQFIRNIPGDANDYPMPFGDEGTYFYVTDAAAAADSATLTVIAGGLVADVNSITDTAVLRFVDFATVRLKAPYPKIRVQASISKLAQVRLKAPYPRIRVEAITNYITQVRLKAPYPKIRVEAMVNRGATIRLKAPYPRIRVEAIVNRIARVRLKVPYPRIRVYAKIKALTDEFDIVAINTVNAAHTEYTGYDFNSFAIINGKLYCASDDGLFYENDLNDQTLDWYFKTGDVDSYKGTETMGPVVKREFVPYLSYEAEGQLKLIVEGDKDGAYEYPIIDERVIIGKGFNSRFYSFKVKNINSKTGSFENIRLMARPTVRVR